MATTDKTPGCCTFLKGCAADGGCLQGHVKFLGVMQVLLGVVQVLGGIVLAITVPYSPAVKIATPWWSGVMSIISGVVCIRCAGAPTEEFKKTTLVINALQVTSTLIAICMYGMSTSLSLMLVTDFLPLIPWTLTCVLIGFSVWDLVVTIPVCVAYYKHHPRVRRYHHTH
ncbi:uncharacterized protein LOC122544064 isoform X2 [Chiloscyllium plagiosum]|uniref:uncharacterized protein LOC122544064 isoform X2 n=1 Tax=Chiloscyllium plagiosum TaxID=36176 RepID=UPI001CB82C9B|nr:uncharacterized protein LOC122544064 isoform X2 [Chiloscyllium plagiosum]XP_043538997.1 uncharacterized protein LOC122544064 isoform X2 [Chiloscyllium plagiosum]XP_043538998.1 uncharacterized protein LOC122544064 isoform X2 [Chiloscyllium plagiosum]